MDLAHAPLSNFPIEDHLITKDGSGLSGAGESAGVAEVALEFGQKQLPISPRIPLRKRHIRNLETEEWAQLRPVRGSEIRSESAT